MRLRRKWFVVAAVLASLSVTGASLAGTAVLTSFSGSSDDGTFTTLSTKGNVLRLAGPTIAGQHYEHMAFGRLSEGYVLCYRNARGQLVNAYDVGSAESGFGPPQTAVGPTWAQVVRTTTDGLLTLKLGITFDGKRKRMETGGAVINKGKEPVTGVIFRRQADFDVDAGGAQGFSNGANLWGRTSRDSVFAWNDPSSAPAGRESHGMLMTHVATSVFKNGQYTGSPPRTIRTAKVTENPLDTSCNPPSKATPVTVPSDDGGTIQVDIGTIDAAPPEGGDTRVAVLLIYQRI